MCDITGSFHRPHLPGVTLTFSTTVVCEVLFFCMQHLDMLTLSVFKATWGKKKRKKIYSRSNNSWLKANSKDELSKPLLSSTLSTNCSLSSSFCAQTKKNQSLKLSLYKTVINNCFETSWKCIETAGKDTFSPLRRWWRPNTELKIEIHLTLFHQVGVNPTVEVSCINRQCT